MLKISKGKKEKKYKRKKNNLETNDEKVHKFINRVFSNASCTLENFLGRSERICPHLQEVEARELSAVFCLCFR